MAGSVDVTHWLLLVSFGMLTGVIGQAARVVIGFKKANDEASQKGVAFVFDASRFWISICLGAIAGALAAILTVPSDMVVSKELVLGIVAAGYAGSDFIEGALSRALPSVQSASPEPAPAPSPPAGDESQG